MTEKKKEREEQGEPNWKPRVSGVPRRAPTRGLLYGGFYVPGWDELPRAVSGDTHAHPGVHATLGRDVPRGIEKARLEGVEWLEN